MTSRAERDRLADTGPLMDGLAAANPWYLWGPYLAERAWGTVREDYGAQCSGWHGLSHDQARSQAYRWNEEGLAGICDAEQRLCLALALWNGVDPILKERIFGLTNDEGNHGEDAKEYWWYRDALPSGALLSWRYHYPQREFPYAWLVEEAARRRATGPAPEPELLDSGVFDQDRYWVIEVDYAKAGPEDIRLRIRATNAGPDPAELHLLPTLWFRNTWAWTPGAPRPDITRDGDTLVADHPTLGRYRLTASGPASALFCDNDSNDRRLYSTMDGPDYPKDGINDHVVRGAATVNPAQHGTKAAWWYRLRADPGQMVAVDLRLSTGDDPGPADLFERRRAEADEFYRPLAPPGATAEEAAVQRQAFASLLWSKQYYPFDVTRWLDGDPGQPPPPPQRQVQPPGRDTRWRHLRAADVFSMPDTWEYPWFAAWDLAFHSVVMAHLDPDFAKHQLRLLTLPRYQHPDGNLPAYEWEFSDINPPVHAWAAMKVYHLDGSRDRAFLADLFARLQLDFAWWLRSQDERHDNLFGGGFLGLDNVGPFNRSAPPDGIRVEQADATAWMAFYCLAMLHIAGELALGDPAYEPAIREYLVHFTDIGRALADQGLWDPEDGFFFDRVHWPDGRSELVKVHSIVGVVALFAAAVLPHRLVEDLPPGYADQNRPGFVTYEPGTGRALVTLAGLDHLTTILREVLAEEGFLSPYGIRSLSRRYADRPAGDGTLWTVDYQPAEADPPSVNSNWRGPVWFPVNYLLLESLRHIGRFCGDDLRAEFPTGSGDRWRLDDISENLRGRLISLFLPGPDGRRPSYGWIDRFWHDDRWRDSVLFFEYFQADNGAGLGASHQTGWTALVADLIQGHRISPAAPPG